MVLMQRISGWGRYPQVKACVSAAETPSCIADRIARWKDCIARGSGKSYGDSALSGRILWMEPLNRILSFDATQGEVVCEAGVSLAKLIDVFLPRGFFLAVTPGTKLITVGGAIASDVHGKNHHRAGCFSSCVNWFDLMLADGRIVRCSREENGDLFRATCGGMGLTGVILKAGIRLQRVVSAWIDQRIVYCRDLDAVLAAFDTYSHVTYSVAWIDCLKTGKALGRAVLMVGEHADSGGLVPPQPRRLSVPFTFPEGVLNPMSIRLFNAGYAWMHRRNEGESRVPIDAFFYPLDGIEQWNRMYGPRGFLQYQFVLPRSEGADGLYAILSAIAAEGMGSFLAVLKLFGPANDHFLSFPMEGYTLALDFGIRPGLFAFLDRLDRLVVRFGGRIYLTKDVRMSPGVFRSGYPGLDRFLEIKAAVDPQNRFRSLQSSRLMEGACMC